MSGDGDGGTEHEGWAQRGQGSRCCRHNLIFSCSRALGVQRDAAAAGKASFAWAWMLDERPEERARGVTVDVAVSRYRVFSGISFRVF